MNMQSYINGVYGQFVLLPQIMGAIILEFEFSW